MSRQYPRDTSGNGDRSSRDVLRVEDALDGNRFGMVRFNVLRNLILQVEKAGGEGAARRVLDRAVINRRHARARCVRTQ